MRNTFVKIFLIFPFVCLISCKKFIQIEPSPDLIQTSQIFQDDKTALSAVVDIYIQMRISSIRFTEAGMTIYGALLADEIHNTSSNEAWDPFTKNNLSSTNSSIKTNFWGAAYENVYKINAIIEGLQNTNKLTASTKDQLLGEMKMTRAWYYFYLVNLFGDVPLILQTNYETNATLPRTANDKIYEQIISDLTEASNLLATNYPSPDKARPNSLTAKALLARVYLYLQNWEKAESYATEVISSNEYNLESDLALVFLVNSTETIWQIAPVNGEGNTGIGNRTIPSSATRIPTFTLTDTLLNSFDPNDLRKSNWLKSNTISGRKYYYPYKYKRRTATTPVEEYNVVLRLAEQYLIRGEARAQQNKISGPSSAEEDVNVIRNRAGLPNTTALTQAEMLTAIEKERQIELFCEWGHRWLDLKRNGRSDSVLGFIKASDWQSTDVLLPIPFDQIQYNSFLTQNPGY